jgi:hypothetical protein
MAATTTLQRQRAGNEIDRLLLRIKGLVYVRELLLQRGASETELEEHSAEIGRLRWRLARLVKGDLEGRAAA